jgi:hypothetical protein
MVAQRTSFLQNQEGRARGTESTEKLEPEKKKNGTLTFDDVVKSAKMNHCERSEAI